MSPISIQTVTRLRFLIFCGVILFYACFGYPTPDQPGMTELLIGMGLVLSLGLPQVAFGILTTQADEPLWMKPARLLLIYGLSAPLIMALIIGNEMNAILRDMFPFLFMMLPFFAYDLFQKLDKRAHKQIMLVVLVAGLIFSLRGYLVLRDGGYIVQNIDALYLVNAPTVLYAALFLCGTAIYTFRLSKPLRPILSGLLTLLPIAAMGAVLQRASFGALILSASVLWALVLKQSLLRALLLILGAGIVILMVSGAAIPLIESLLEKNRLVGSNMRLYELQAVWERVVETAPRALFGQGWGGTVRSPAVGGLTVNFTHSLISAALLKTGIIGTMLTLSYLGLLFLRFPSLYRASPVLACALFWPFVIDIFLYASYKSLDFGFILMLIACYGLSKEKEYEQHPTGQRKKDIDGQSRVSPGTSTDGTAAL